MAVYAVFIYVRIKLKKYILDSIYGIIMTE